METREKLVCDQVRKIALKTLVIRNHERFWALESSLWFQYEARTENREESGVRDEERGQLGSH